MDDLLKIAQIVAPHGVRGEAKALILTDFPERFRKLKTAFLVKEGKKDNITIEKVRIGERFVFIKFAEYNSPEAIHKIRGAYLEIPKTEAHPLPEGHYYICDLIGCVVFSQEGRKLGIVKDILKTGANDVFVIEREGKFSSRQKDILIPIIKEFVTSIDITNKKVEVKLLSGLVED